MSRDQIPLRLELMVVRCLSQMGLKILPVEKLALAVTMIKYSSISDLLYSLIQAILCKRTTQKLEKLRI